jgi:ribosomal-protein-alanine N-acetyltransferase
MIRTFVMTDLDRILEIEQHSFPRSPYSKVTLIHLHWLYPKTFWVYVGQPNDQEKEKVYGYLISSKDGHLISLAVHPNHRRRGIGERLIRKAVESLAVKRIWAEVRQSNQGALAFYRTIGFQIEGTVANYYGNEDALIVQFPQA